MALVWITCGGVVVVAALYFLRRRTLRCYLCSKRIRGAERSAHYTVDGRRRVVCGRCDDANLRLTSTEQQGR